MTTRDLINPELLGLPDCETWLDLTSDDLPIVHARDLELIAADSTSHAITTEVVYVPGATGAPPVALRIFHPSKQFCTTSALRPALYQIHGGGFVMGFAAMSDAATARRAIEHNCVVVAVDYRLAPGTPFPGRLDDCHAELLWLSNHAQLLAIDPARIVVLGESAGGGLAAALSILARDRTNSSLAGLFLVYPMLDCRAGWADDMFSHPDTGVFRWNRVSNQFVWCAMCGGRAVPEARLGHFSPSLEAKLRGLPQTFIAVGALNLFVEENMVFASAVARAGVQVQLNIYPGAFHGFDLAKNAAISRKFHDEAGQALTWMLRPNLQPRSMGMSI